MEKRFKVGDWIIVENIIEGIVEGIGFRSTVVRKFDKSLAIIPNFQFAENAVINVSATTNWRISWIITLQYSTTIEQLKNPNQVFSDLMGDDVEPRREFILKNAKYATNIDT